MGVVYEAHDAVIDRKVAIKLVRTELLEGKERQDYVERFQREAQAVGRCNHPCIVAIFDYALHEGNPFLVMEYVDGVGLDKAISQGERFPPSAAIHVILHVLDALGCAHGAGIVHRDIKPGNVLLMTGGGVKVTDFGVARLESSNLTLDGMAIGTPRYMSPEQCCGGAVDPRSDLFSVAVMLQEMLIGERPFPGRNLTEIACGLLRDPPAGGEAVEGIAGSAVKRVIQRALAKAPEDRYASASIMANALREAVGQAMPQSSPAASIDKTVIAVRARSSSPPSPGGGTFEPVLLSNIERRLANRLGPIARYLVQTLLPTATSVENLCDLLAQRIDRADDRKRFLTEALEAVRSGTTANPPAGSQPSKSLLPTPIPVADIERARRALAETLGPIATVLVQRALRQAQTPQDLWNLLAAHIGPDLARAAFLAQRDKG
jgi:serine/threonine-protein kinase